MSADKAKHFPGFTKKQFETLADAVRNCGAQSFDAYQRQNGAMIAEMRDADGNVIDSFKVDVNGLYD